MCRLIPTYGNLRTQLGSWRERLEFQYVEIERRVAISEIPSEQVVAN